MVQKYVPTDGIIGPDVNVGRKNLDEGDRLDRSYGRIKPRTVVAAGNNKFLVYGVTSVAQATVTLFQSNSLTIQANGTITFGGQYLIAGVTAGGFTAPNLLLPDTGYWCATSAGATG